MAHREDPEGMKQMREDMLQGTEVAKQQRDVEMEGLMKGLPFPQDRLKSFDDAMNKINDTCLPTIEGLDDKENILELQDKVFNVVWPLEGELNNCLYRARNMTAANWCADQMITKLNGEGYEKIKNILREY